MTEETKTTDKSIRRYGDKIKVSELMIIVEDSADKPYYSIRYYDLFDNEWHIGFSSYKLSYVMDWKDKYFEIVKEMEDGEHNEIWIRDFW